MFSLAAGWEGDILASTPWSPLEAPGQALSGEEVLSEIGRGPELQDCSFQQFGARHTFTSTLHICVSWSHLHPARRQAAADSPPCRWDRYSRPQKLNEPVSCSWKGIPRRLWPGTCPQESSDLRGRDTPDHLELPGAPEGLEQFVLCGQSQEATFPEAERGEEGSIDSGCDRGPRETESV